jgi:HEAT repeat protein
MRALVVAVMEAALAMGSIVAASADEDTRKETTAARAWRILKTGVNSTKFAERMVALKAMADLGPNVPGVRLAAEVLKDDKDPDIRAQAATTLGEINSRAAILPLRAALDDPAPQVAFAAAKSLWQLGDSKGQRVLLDVLQGQQGTKDSFVAGKIRGMHHTLEDKKALVGMGTAKGAGALLPFPLSLGVGLAKGEISGGANLARADSATLLSHRADPEIMRALKMALEDRDWAVRAAAARAIGRMGRPATAKWLESLLDDEKLGVRYEAAVSIVRLASLRPGSTSATNGGPSSSGARSDHP